DARPRRAAPAPPRSPPPPAALAAVPAYHYRLVVDSAAGTTRSTDATFTTPALPAPQATILPADGLSMTGAVLHASIDPSGLATTYHFEYGTGAGYQDATAQAALASPTDVAAVSATLTGLSVGSTYHYRVVARNSTGATTSADVSFTTSPWPPPVVVSIDAPSAVTRTGLTLGAKVDPSWLWTTAHLEYGTDTHYRSSTPAAQLDRHG